MIPDYLIIKKCFSGGRRLSKRPKVEYYATSSQRDDIGYGGRHLPSHYHGIGAANQKPSCVFGPSEGAIYDSTMEFAYWEFRFWAIENFDEMKVAVCRVCEGVETTKDKRRSHAQKHGCTDRLVSAYKLLCREPKRCVICDALTVYEKFSVPICMSFQCIEKWYFTPCPEAVAAALMIEERTGA